MKAGEKETRRHEDWSEEKEEARRGGAGRCARALRNSKWLSGQRRATPRHASAASPPLECWVPGPLQRSSQSRCCRCCCANPGRNGTCTEQGVDNEPLSALTVARRVPTEKSVRRGRISKAASRPQQPALCRQRSGRPGPGPGVQHSARCCMLGALIGCTDTSPPCPYPLSHPFAHLSARRTCESSIPLRCGRPVPLAASGVLRDGFYFTRVHHVSVHALGAPRPTLYAIDTTRHPRRADLPECRAWGGAGRRGEPWENEGSAAGHARA